MRGMILLPLLLVVFGAAALATPLDDGVLITHHVRELEFSTMPPPAGWCEAYQAFALQSWEDQVTRIDVTDVRAVIWFIIAAWGDPDKECCGVSFGLDAYNPDLFAIASHGPCFPGHGLNLPTPGWPGPGEGIQLASVDTPWTGNLIPLYWFGGYAYEEPEPGQVPLGVDPRSGRAAFAECDPPHAWWDAIALGAIGINTDGIYVEPTPDRWACCHPVHYKCRMETERACAELGWLWFEGATCTPPP